MKIRIKGNSLRLRLTQSEVQQLHQEGFVEEKIMFGIDPTEHLRYKIAKSKNIVINVSYKPNEITVTVPENMLATWASTNLVGLEHQIKLEGEERLSILIEKDFKCLQERPGEDESDMFPNPDEGNLTC